MRQNRISTRLAMMLTAMCISTYGWAQTKDSIDCTVFTVGYDYTVNTTDKDGNAVTDSLHTVLLVGSKVTKTMGYYTHKYKVLMLTNTSITTSTSARVWHMCRP